jgi:hypothetical protein
LLDHGLITEKSNESQYRFQDIVDLATGECVATIEHEVRSMRHPLYARPLRDRNAFVPMAMRRVMRPQCGIYHPQADD